jgi:phage recombination protein Bet
MAQQQVQKSGPANGGVSTTQLVIKMAEKQDLDPQAYASTVMKTCFSGNTTPEQFMAFLMIAREHGLNPITREIFAFESRGKVMPIVSIDGWLKIINEHPQFNGMQFVDTIDDDSCLISITCKIHRRDRDLPTEVTEYLDECKMNTEPWKKWPARMLRHKATIQAARYAFGFAGIYDQDEAQRMDSIPGHAEVVEDEPATAAKRIVGKVLSKAKAEDIAPPADAQEPVETVTDDGEIVLEDIPGLKKGSDVPPPPEELTPEQQAFVDEMDGDK